MKRGLYSNKRNSRRISVPSDATSRTSFASFAEVSAAARLVVPSIVVLVVVYLLYAYGPRGTLDDKNVSAPIREIPPTSTPVRERDRGETRVRELTPDSRRFDLPK